MTKSFGGKNNYEHNPAGRHDTELLEVIRFDRI